MSPCTCPHVDGYRLRKQSCPVHGPADAEVFAAKAAERDAEQQAQADIDVACAWSDFRKDYGVSGNDETRRAEHRAFKAGYEAARLGDQSAALR